MILLGCRGCGAAPSITQRKFRDGRFLVEMHCSTGFECTAYLAIESFGRARMKGYVYTRAALAWSAANSEGVSNGD